MKKYVMILTLALVTMFAFTACGRNTDPVQDSNSAADNAQANEPTNELTSDPVETFYPDIYLFHESAEMGIYFSIHPAWHTLYGIETSEFEHEYGITSTTTVYHIATREMFGSDSGRMFWINRFPDTIPNDEPGAGIILAQAGGYTYAIGYPQDSEHAFDSDHPTAVQFWMMWEYLNPWDNNFVTNSFRLITPTASDGILQRFSNLGFSVEFPVFWEGKYGLHAFDVDFDFGTRHMVEVYHIATREKMLAESGFPYGGRIMSLGRSPREDYTYDYPPIMAGGTIFLAQTGGNTYFVNFPSGVEHNEDPNSETAAEYLEMIGHWEPSHWDFLTNSFRLTELPAAATSANTYPPLQLTIYLTPENAVAIEANVPLRDVAWAQLDHDFVNNEFIFIPSIIYASMIAELLPGSLFAKNDFIDNGGVMPTNAITFIDQYDERRYFAFQQDQSLGLEPSPYMADFFDHIVNGQVQIYATTGGGDRTDLGYFDVDTNNFDPDTWFTTNSYRWAAHILAIWELANVYHE